MKRVLLCTIMRNQRANVETWLEQLVRLWEVLVNNGYEVEASVCENDSTDGTAQWLRAGGVQSMPPFKWHVSTEVLGTTQYGSIWSVDRLCNLAAARQRCLDQVGPLDRFTKIAFIEPDVTYDPAWCVELILARHPLAVGLGEPDVYSGWSLRTEANPKESVFLYDTCATRATKDDVTWDIGEQGGQWRAASVVPTDLGGHDAMCLHHVWSTFNCFCVYNAAPFHKGLPQDRVRWGYVNTRLHTGQQRIEDGDNGSGTLDADTAVLCERFRARGFDKVYLNTNCLIRHA